MRRQLQRSLLQLAGASDLIASQRAVAHLAAASRVLQSPISPETIFIPNNHLHFPASARTLTSTVALNSRSFASSATSALEAQAAGSAAVQVEEAPPQQRPPPSLSDSMPEPATASSPASHLTGIYTSSALSSQRHALDKKMRHGFKAEAVYVGSRINVMSLLNRPEFESKYKKLHKGGMIVALTDKHIPDQCEAEGMPLEPFLVAFDYGSAVFFNTNRDLKERCLTILRSEASDPIPIDTERSYTEDISVAVTPGLEAWSQQDADCINLKVLDLRNMQVISQVLAQSVAMDFYSDHVERKLETFCSLNLEMLEFANLTKVNKQHVLRLVAENNIVMTEIISKLGVHERYDIAWKHVEYGRIWEFLRAELEMDARFKTLDMKLNLIQDNLKYILELLQAKKSDSLEWTIIILIGAEICLSLYELATKSGVA